MFTRFPLKSVLGMDPIKSKMAIALYNAQNNAPPSNSLMAELLRRSQPPIYGTALLQATGRDTNQ